METPDGARVRLPAQSRKVLAVLAVTRDAPLSTEQIVRRVWPGDPPDSAIQMVRNQIAALRRIFGTSSQEVVVRDHVGYRIARSGCEIDAELFGSLVDEGRLLRIAGRTSEAVRTIQRALDLWRGPEALADMRDVPDLQVAAMVLEESWFQAEEMVAEGYLALGHPEDALPILRMMTTLYPSRELPWLQLMAAQALIGRRIEASVETFRQAQHHLVEETGLDAPRLAEVHQALLRGIHGQELVAMVLRVTRRSVRSERRWAPVVHGDLNPG